jgi:glutamate dehydrogenase
MLVSRILALPRDDRWQTMARAALRDDLHTVHAQLTNQVLAATDPGADAADRVAAWEASDGDAIVRAAATFEEICSDDSADLARMSVALRVVRSLLDAA